MTISDSKARTPGHSPTGMARIRRALTAVAASLMLFTSEAGAQPLHDKGKVCERHMQRYAGTYGIPLGILYSVGLTETGRRGSLHPHALNIEGKSRFAASRSEAIGIFRAARRRGAKLIDIGCMQINHHYHRQAFATLGDMFDPERNVAYAARFLRKLRLREGSWTMAVARYHAGPNNDPAQKRYVCAVIANLVASGFGKWTRNSRKFCK